MNTRNTTLIVAVLIVLATLAGLIVWNQLPDPMASHWSIDGQVNGTTGKLAGVFLLPAMSIGLFLLFLLIPAIDPLKANIAKFRGTYNTFIVLLTVFLIYVHGLQLAWNLGYVFRMNIALLPAVGLLFILMGFLIEKAKRNFFIGIRTPWTLSSDTVWDETHRAGGLLFKLSGLLALLGVLFPDFALLFMLVPLIGSALFTVIYSYVLYARETKTA